MTAIKKKIYLIAGEPSGDLHAANLMKYLKKIDENINFRFLGGDLMKKQGGTLVKHYKTMAFMGLWEVIKNLKTIKKNLLFCKKDIIQFKPDIIILIDYPGFNLRIAKFAKKNNIEVIYYISPKIWAWKKNRVHKIKKYIDKLFVIFPFEIEFYKKYNYETYYYGNPTAHIIYNLLNDNFNKDKFRNENNLTEKPIIALLPGSRVQEIEKILPEMVHLTEKFVDYQFVVAGVSVIEKSMYDKLLLNTKIKFVQDKTYELLRTSEAAVVTSGTATLETAMLNIPQVVCYKTSKLTYFIGKLLVKIKYFSLVNIILQTEAVKELLQTNLKIEIENELFQILNDENYRKKMLDNYKVLSNLLHENNSPQKTAEKILY